MASDPNRDILPVKEDCCRSGKVSSEKFDHQILGKLSRCELEDRFLRLLDEQTHIKKLANCQEEKIKRLGTKLLRLINEKKNGKRPGEQGKESEDLHLRVIELEHENYALKDKNIVLKQQLASHSRHLSSHRSPVRSNHTSPLMSVRQPGTQAQSEIAFDTGNKNGMADVQLQEAEAHIRELNEEIKSLHNKIDYLQQNLEKNSLDSQKVKVTENIELIRLQRSLKQQAIQIAALQAQVKNSESSQRVLKEELTRAHKENDEALHLISEKQNEILNLCSKLEEKNLNRLEESELKERINDLMLERDCLKERSELLMKTIGTKSEEAEKINELRQQLAEEKRKKEQLEEALEATRKCVAEIPKKCLEIRQSEKSKAPEDDSRCQAQQVPKAQHPLVKESLASAGENSEESASSSNKSKCNCHCGQENESNPEPESDTESRETCEGKAEPECSQMEGRYAAEKMKLERELEYLREMLRSQTCRCEAQQAEISRLMYELRVNEEKCNKTLRRLDMHLTIFEQLEMRTRQNDKSAGEPVRLRSEIIPEKAIMAPKAEATVSEQKPPRSREVMHVSSDEKKPVSNSKARRYSSEGSLSFQPSAKDHLGSKEQLSRKTLPGSLTKEDGVNRESPLEPKKRFIEQTFLDSSDEEMAKDENFTKESFILKLRELDRSSHEQGMRKTETHEGKLRREPSNKLLQRRLSSNTLMSGPESSMQFRNESLRDDKGTAHSKSQYKSFANQSSNDKITISVLWLKIDPEGSLWKKDNVRLLFIDFTFLDVNGEDTESPESLKKPSSPDEKCIFNYSSVIPIHRGRKEILKSLLHKPDLDLLIFKVVSDSENFNELNYECEDIGVAVVSVKQFMEQCNKDAFLISVRNPENTAEIIGALAIKIEASPGVFTF